MGLFDFIRGQLLEIIEWTDDSRDTLSFRFPDEDKAIKRGAQLIVRESQVVQFVYLGQYGDLFGPGKHTLTTDNIPVLTALASWKYGFESPFKADVYYITTRVFSGNKWGTQNPFMLRDQDLGVVREVAGTDHHFRLDEFDGVMRSRVVSVFSEALASAHVPIFDVATRYSELGESLLPIINPITQAKYGLEFTAFVVENVSVPPEVEEAIDKRSSMSAVGNLNDFVKFQLAQGLGQGGSAGSAPAELAMGLAMAKQLIDGQSSGSTPAANGGEEVLTPAEVARQLNVSEADLMVSIEAGDLRAKKIGSTYRITRSALQEFLK
ncbi:MAG: SPFH domain-containing protein [Verrucomicrobia bacterium]|nr:SPFH domain-containing protein [Verrucomicrobiota bacterium]